MTPTELQTIYQLMYRGEEVQAERGSDKDVREYRRARDYLEHQFPDLVGPVHHAD